MYATPQKKGQTDLSLVIGALEEKEIDFEVHTEWYGPRIQWSSGKLAYALEFHRKDDRLMGSEIDGQTLRYVPRQSHWVSSHHDTAKFWDLEKTLGVKLFKQPLC